MSNSKLALKTKSKKSEKQINWKVSFFATVLVKLAIYQILWSTLEKRLEMQPK
jgi:hypothetical protein